MRQSVRLLALGALALVLLAAPGRPPFQADEFVPHAIFTTASGEEVRLNLEVADTVDKQTRGLMFRTELAEDWGMLFLFEGTVQIGFWMKNTLLPLSICFVDEKGTIVDILDMQPQTENVNVPKSPYRYAIEVNQGYFARHNIAVGDSVRLVLSPP